MSLYIAREPKYTYSLRRLRAEGGLRSIRKSLEIELSRLLKKKISIPKVKYLYPMEGGTYYEINSKRKLDQIILQKLAKLFNL